MKYLVLMLTLVLAACSNKITSTAQYVYVDIIGTDEAYCTLSTDDNRYALSAPGEAYVERDIDDLVIDCRDNYSNRRRVVSVESHVGGVYWSYPEKVTVDFTTSEFGSRYEGFQDIKPHSGNSQVKSILTEESFSLPVSTEQQYPVKKQYTMGRASYPVSIN